VTVGICVSGVDTWMMAKCESIFIAQARGMFYDLQVQGLG